MLRIICLLFMASLVRAKFINPEIESIAHPFIKSRIVGGHNANIKDFPHQISLQYSGVHFCGGSIYKSNIVITAAHCVKDFNALYIKVAAGSSFKNVIGQVVPVKKYIIHNEYDIKTFNNDIAILLLDGHLEFNEKVKPISLATSRPRPGSKVTVTGWGKTNFGFTSIILQQVQVEVVNQTRCKKTYSRLYNITSSMICAGHKKGGKDSCQSDSGGPLSYGHKLIGVVSFGKGCDLKKFPGVYASIPDLHDWIIKIVLENEK